jgi:hypothetical protein
MSAGANEGDELCGQSFPLALAQDVPDLKQQIRIYSFVISILYHKVMTDAEA